MEIVKVNGTDAKEMADGIRSPHEIAFEAFGVRLAVGAPDETVLEHVRTWLPPGWKPCAEAVEARFLLLGSARAGAYDLKFWRQGWGTDPSDLTGMGRDLDLDLALELLDFQLRVYLGRMSRDVIFIHAGAVAHKGAAMVMPSFPFSGKTTLVAALVRAGAVYYSDEFAVIDRDGFVHPYAKPLSLREDPEDWPHDHRPVESFGGVAGVEPAPLRMIVATSYQEGAGWSPTELSAGAGAAALLQRAVPARERSQEVLQTVSRVAQRAVTVGGHRGEAEEVAPLLLEELERLSG